MQKLDINLPPSTSLHDILIIRYSKSFDWKTAIILHLRHRVNVINLYDRIKSDRNSQGQKWLNNKFGTLANIDRTSFVYVVYLCNAYKVILLSSLDYIYVCTFFFQFFFLPLKLPRLSRCQLPHLPSVDHFILVLIQCFCRFGSLFYYTN